MQANHDCPFASEEITTRSISTQSEKIAYPPQIHPFIHGPSPHPPVAQHTVLRTDHHCGIPCRLSFSFIPLPPSHSAFLCFSPDILFDFRSSDDHSDDNSVPSLTFLDDPSSCCGDGEVQRHPHHPSVTPPSQLLLAHHLSSLLAKPSFIVLSRSSHLLSLAT